MNLEYTEPAMRPYAMKILSLARREDEQKAEINFDLTRMKLAVSGGSIRIPAGMSREDKRKWIRENGGKCHA